MILTAAHREMLKLSLQEKLSVWHSVAVLVSSLGSPGVRGFYWVEGVALLSLWARLTGILWAPLSALSLFLRQLETFRRHLQAASLTLPCLARTRSAHLCLEVAVPGVGVAWWTHP